MPPNSAGYCAGTLAARWASLVAGNLGAVGVYAGNGDRTAEALQALPLVLANAPTRALLCIGRNDLSAGVATATWQGNYASMVSQLRAAGFIVVHLLPIPESVQDQSVLASWIAATYPNDKRVVA